MKSHYRTLHYIAYHRETGASAELTVLTNELYNIVTDGVYKEEFIKARNRSVKDDVEFFMRLHYPHKTNSFIWDVRKVAKGTIPWDADMYFEFSRETR